MGIRDRALAARKTQAERGAFYEKKSNAKLCRIARRRLSRLLQNKIKEDQLSWATVKSQYGHDILGVTYDGIQFLYRPGYSRNYGLFSMRVGDEDLNVTSLSDVGEYLLRIEAANPEITEFERVRSILIEKYL